MAGCWVARGAVAYVLLRVLHDWSDEDALRILRRVRAAMEPSARLLIVDGVVRPPNEDPLTKFLDPHCPSLATTADPRTRLIQFDSSGNRNDVAHAVWHVV